jgi:hypothetical protein
MKIAAPMALALPVRASYVTRTSMRINVRNASNPPAVGNQPGATGGEPEPGEPSAPLGTGIANPNGGRIERARLLGLMRKRATNVQNVFSGFAHGLADCQRAGQLLNETMVKLERIDKLLYSDVPSLSAPLGPAQG